MSVVVRFGCDCGIRLDIRTIHQLCFTTVCGMQTVMDLHNNAACSRCCRSPEYFKDYAVLLEKLHDTASASARQLEAGVYQLIATLLKEDARKLCEEG